MTPSVFRGLRDIAYESAGIALSPGKHVLLSARLARRMRELGMGDPRDYLARLREDRSGRELVTFLDAVSTNFTSFFRERGHFDLVAEEARKAISRGADRFRIWCAASSSGEEAYSLAITLAETPGIAQLTHRILASDISTRMLHLAKEGSYSAEQLEPVPPQLRTRYFRREAPPMWTASAALKASLVFAKLNLAVTPFALKGPFDVVMCRNVMIYFDTPVRQRLVAEIERLLRPGGLLLVGHAESLSGVVTSLRASASAAYRREGVAT